MEIDAANAGVNPGGLVSKDEIMILICYILNAVGSPVPAQKLSDLFHMEGMANYFETGSAFATLYKNGNIKKCGGEDDCYTVTDSGKNIAETLKTSVPLSVRDRTLEITVKMLSKLQNERETRVDVIPDAAGYMLRCAVCAGETELMAVKLLVTDEAQAYRLKDRFLDDPSKIYTGIIELMTGSKIS